MNRTGAALSYVIRQPLLTLLVDNSAVPVLRSAQDKRKKAFSHEQQIHHRHFGNLRGVQRGLSLSDFSPRKAKNNSNRFFRGRVPRKKLFSACKCASVPRKRARAAGCKPSRFTKMPSGNSCETNVKSSHSALDLCRGRDII